MGRRIKTPEEIIGTKPKYFLGREVLSTQWLPHDMTRIFLKTEAGYQWIDIESRDAEEYGLIPRTLRMRPRDPKEIKKDYIFTYTYYVIRSLILLWIVIYSYMTENIAGLGFSLGLLIMSVSLPFLTPPMIDKYEKRK